MNVAPQKRRADAVVYSRAAVASDTVATDSRTVDVVASTDTIDSHGTILKQNWKLDRYRANPVVLYAHDSDDLPIGTASNVRIENGQLRATITLSGADLNPLAEQVWLNIKAGVLRGISVGFWPHTVQFETHDDREVLVFDDLELLEISVVPVGSNPETLAEMRSRAVAQRQAAPGPAPQQQPAPVPVAAVTHVPPTGKERKIMSDKPEISQFVQAVTIALGLPVGSTESDILARAATLHTQDRETIALAGAATSAEAVGAMRGIKAKADLADVYLTELTKVRGERDRQNLDTLIVSGKSDRKLDAALAQMYEDEFTQAAPEARSAVVDRLRGHLKVLKPAFPAVARQVGSVATMAAEQTWNGKTYAQLGPQERANLKAADPELSAVMRRDWEAAGKPAAQVA